MRSFCLSSSVQVFLLDVTTPRNSDAWNYRELATLHTLRQRLAEDGFEPFTIGSMGENRLGNPRGISLQFDVTG